MPLGKIIYGSYMNSAVFKDRKGYFVGDWDPKTNKEFKKYLPEWKPTSEDDRTYYNEITKKWQITKPKPASKYSQRKSPPYPANQYCGKTKKGNDGKLYISTPNKNNVCTWKLKK